MCNKDGYMKMKGIGKLYDKLSKPPKEANKKWYQNRGREFEKILHSILDIEKLKPRTNFRPNGEEIDGSFIFNGKVFLIEAKWHENPIPASVLYSFKGKIDGKLTGTIGIFISMSNYSKDAIDTLTKGKNINLILFGDKDILTIIEGDKKFSNILEYKLRKAAEEGIVFIEPKMEEIFIKPNKKVFTTTTCIDSVTQPNTLAFICEGVTDQLVIQELLAKVITKFYSKAKIRIIVAGGRYNLSNVANILEGEYKKIFLVTDSDGNPKSTKQFLLKNLKIKNFELLILENNIEEDWLNLNKSEINKLKMNTKSELIMAIRNYVSKIEIQDLCKRSENFVKIMNEVQKIETY